MTILTKKNILNFCIIAPVIFTFTGMFLYENGPKNVLVLILLSCVLSIFHHGYSHIKQQLLDNKFLWLLFIITIYGLIQDHTHGYSSGLIKTYFALAIYFSIVPTKVFSLFINKVTPLCLLASICTLTFFVTQTIVNNSPDRLWEINVIDYSTFCAWLATYSLASLFVLKDRKNALAHAFIISINLYVIFSGRTRGVILALAVMSIYLIYKSIAYNKSNLTYATSLLILSLLSFFAIKDSNFLSTRVIDLTKHEIAKVENGDFSGNIGLRLEMWKSAFYVGQINPFFGVGDNHLKYKKILADQNLISQTTASFRHYHNDLINSFVKSGIIGSILTLLILISPAITYIRSKKRIALPSLLLSGTFFIAGLTNVPLYNLNLLFFFLVTTWIYHCYCSEEKSTQINT